MTDFNPTGGTDSRGYSINTYDAARQAFITPSGEVYAVRDSSGNWIPASQAPTMATGTSSYGGGVVAPGNTVVNGQVVSIQPSTPSGTPAPVTQGGQPVQQNINTFQQPAQEQPDLFKQIGVGIPVALINLSPLPFAINKEGQGGFTLEKYNPFNLFNAGNFLSDTQTATTNLIKNSAQNDTRYFGVTTSEALDTASALTYAAGGVGAAAGGIAIGGTVGLVTGGLGLVTVGSEAIPVARTVTSVGLTPVLGDKVKVKNYTQEQDLAKIGLQAASKDYETNILKNENPIIGASGQIVNAFLPFAATGLRQPAAQTAIYNKLIGEGYSEEEALATAKFISVKYVSGGAVGGTAGFALQNVGTEVIGIAGAKTMLNAEIKATEGALNKTAFARTALGVAPAGFVEGVAYSRQEDYYNLNKPNAWKDLTYGGFGALSAGTISGLAVGTSKPYASGVWNAPVIGKVNISGAAEKAGTLFGGQAESEGNIIGARYAELVGESKINFNPFAQSKPSMYSMNLKGKSIYSKNTGDFFGEITAPLNRSIYKGGVATNISGIFSPGSSINLPTASSSTTSNDILDIGNIGVATNIIGSTPVSPAPNIPIQPNPPTPVQPTPPVPVNPEPEIPTDEDTTPEVPVDIVTNIATNVNPAVIVPTVPGFGLPFGGLPGGDAFGGSGKGRGKKKYYNELEAAFGGIYAIDTLSLPGKPKKHRRRK